MHEYGITSKTTLEQIPSLEGLGVGSSLEGLGVGSSSEGLGVGSSPEGSGIGYRAIIVGRCTQRILEA